MGKSEREEQAVKYWDKFDKKISRLSMFMNNTKWFKLFETLAAHNINRVRAKFLFDDEDEIFEKPVIKNIFQETGFRDSAMGAPFLYKQLEWIKVTGITETVINELGKFEYEKDGEAIKIYGYK